MWRCIELARLGAGNTAPNPMVGAVLVYDGHIIGEGYHQQYGQAHAEVNCIASVKPEQQYLIEQSTLYVSLEPCAHFGKTPPCADLIVQKKISKVVIGCRDPFEAVNGKGIEKLKSAGIHTEVGMLEKDCMDLNKRFFYFHTKKRPYIILKWAQSADSKIGSREGARIKISNEFTNRLTHRWRGEEGSILVGTHTAFQDDPELTTRYWKGPNPVRLVLDLKQRLHAKLKIFNGEAPTIIFNAIRNEKKGNLHYYRINDNEQVVEQILDALYELKIQSVIVEGGAQLLQSFIDKDLWDEARVIENQELLIPEGVNAPSLKKVQLSRIEKIFSDTIHFYQNPLS
ncbi:MAG: bifunctional diaminohydroxyphosphoribosylaminopyrimidine deaminase/5-amino-6-(5-phosphoribosylamino)uracil reductase RibD [Bacteroidetes bacterium]|nr:bifunctional diaminohydroxyphosphoribosylaminopyrimidine deaminase/5-amino-6-(5-phosphoribosylamino)uracil reductase RibD [Bacteroidota bacterium]